MITSSTIIIFIAFSGFLLAAYIRHKKVYKEALICPLKSNCETVIFSDYSKFFGVPVELLGIAYYLIVVLTYGIFMALPVEMPQILVFGVFSLTIVAFLFSLYLTFIQAFALKQWCTWCLISAGFCTGIFGLAVFASPHNFAALVGEYRTAILTLHLIAAAIGLGGATITDVFFFKFLKDFKISESESEILRTLSQVIWFTLALIVLTGIGLYLPASERLLISSKFLVKMIVVGVIIINGAFLNLLISPKLVHISFGESHHHESGELHRLRKLAFALGAISSASWYSAFILGSLRRLSFSFQELLGIYLILVVIAVIGSQVIERRLVKRAVL
ncbi:MAG: hypothetical protein A2651_02110 [Candidatus Yanofskybacteria bacterium RIFCSPHIGHO2_01_FULL_42_12]|nr:MAG: hypothetical protein A2651_02110 [Candidatus Yanofskybacteria bacterium RIFCSPHIGHO2_01_FULL_42_12]